MQLLAAWLGWSYPRTLALASRAASASAAMARWSCIGSLASLLEHGDISISLVVSNCDINVHQ